MNNTGIYKITNTVNGKFYIGSASSLGGFKRRWYYHELGLNKNKHYNTILQNAWNKYGKESFTFEVLEVISDISLIISKEQFYLDLFKSYLPEIGYNICPVAGNTYGRKHSETTKLKIGDKSRNRTCSEETKIKLSISHKNKHHSEETKNKIKKSNSGEKCYNSKLNKEQIIEIKEIYLKTKLSYLKLGKQYSVSNATIASIINNKTYK